MKRPRPLPPADAASMKRNPDAPASKVVRTLNSKRRAPSKAAIARDDLDFSLGQGS